MKKDKQLIFRATILLLTLIVIVFVATLSWYSNLKTVTADGANITSRGEGVQVSWDGVNYYYDLTALDATKIVAEKLGPALNISGTVDEDGNALPASLKLITGNGLKFFEPYLNRRTGTVLADSSGSWRGVNVTEENSTGKFIDIPLYFRGTSERDIYLAGDSIVSPKTTTQRISDYGAFSRDYIAAASRVAFLDSDKSACSFVWAPNADVELRENADGYTKYTETVTETTTTTSGGDYDLEGFECSKGTSNYYLWTIKQGVTLGTGQQPTSLTYFSARQFTYDAELEFYVAEVTLNIPTYENNPSIPFFITTTSTASEAEGENYDLLVSGSESREQYEQNAQGQYFGITNTNYNIGSYTCSNAFYIMNSAISTGTTVSFKVAYNPEKKHLVILSYTTSEGGSYSRGEESTTITTSVTYYPLGDNITCALVNPQDSVALSIGEHYKKAIFFKDSTKMNVLPVSITASEQFVTEKTGDKAEATYKFKNVKSGQYLNISSGSIAYDSTGSSFSLIYDADVDGPILKSGDYYLVHNNGFVAAVTESQFDAAEAFTVYTGSSYELITDVETSQTYQFYNSTTSQLETLSSTSSPKLFTTTSTTDSSVLVGNTKIGSLTKANETDEYYTTMIVMRIWVEGTDREAKTPLADGIFDASFHFVSK